MATRVGRQERGEPPCARCGGLGWYVLDVAPGDARFGQAQRCACRTAEDAARRWAQVARISDLAPEMNHMRFAAWDAQRFPSARADLERFAANPRGWRVLVGPTGAGKTHLLAAVTWATQEAGRYPLYVVVPRLLRFLRAAQGTGELEAREAALESADLLLLDDLGTEQETEWAMEQVFMILDHRYRHELPTVIASNLKPSQWPFRLASRIRDGGLVTVHTLADPVAADYRPLRGGTRGEEGDRGR